MKISIALIIVALFTMLLAIFVREFPFKVLETNRVEAVHCINHMTGGLCRVRLENGRHVTVNGLVLKGEEVCFNTIHRWEACGEQ